MGHPQPRNITQPTHGIKDSRILNAYYHWCRTHCPFCFTKCLWWHQCCLRIHWHHYLHSRRGEQMGSNQKDRILESGLDNRYGYMLHTYQTLGNASADTAVSSAAASAADHEKVQRAIIHRQFVLSWRRRVERHNGQRRHRGTSPPFSWPSRARRQKVVITIFPGLS